MARRRAEVYILTALLLAALGLCFAFQGEEGLAFDIGGETVRAWENGEERIVFLPSYVNPAQVKSPSSGQPLTFLQSENLPALFLDTASGNLDYIHKEKGNAETGALRLYDETGALRAAGTLEKIQARGNSTFVPEKKPYSLTLSKPADLLGMGAAKNWILLANSMDSSNLKNKFVYDFAIDAGLPYSPESRFVDLYVNGDYRGLYLLCERNEVGPSRVDIRDGFLVSKEQRYNLGSAPSFETEAGALLRIRYNTLGSRMEALFQQAENAILAPDGLDPDTGAHFQDLIDLDSWAGKYLVEEIFDGIDAGIASQFFFYDGAKLFAGPVWDYDETMGAGIWLGGESFLYQAPEIFYAHRAKETPWYHSLYNHDVFYHRMTGLYRDRFSPLLEAHLARLPDTAAQIRQAARLNRLRWDSGDPDAAAEDMAAYLHRRKTFLDDVWIRGGAYLHVQVDFSYDEFICTYAVFDYAVPPGTFLPPLPTIDGYAWYITATDRPFDPGRPILEETAIELRKIV